MAKRTLSAKAWLALGGLLNTKHPGGRSYIKACKINRIALVYCVSSGESVDFALEHKWKRSRRHPHLSLRNMCGKVKALGCTISLHAVSTSKPDFDRQNLRYAA